MRPIASGVYLFCVALFWEGVCSYFCRLENMNHNWKSLLAEPIPISRLYFAKFLCIMSVIVMTQLLIGVLFIISGKLMGFQSKLPISMLGWLAMGTIASMAICAFQLTISLIIRSFALPIGIALIGGIMSIAARAVEAPLAWWYSIFSVGMCASSPQTGLECSLFTFLVICSAFTGIFIVSGIAYMRGTIPFIKAKMKM